MGKEHKKEAKKEEDIRPAWIKQRVQNAFGTVKGFDRLHTTKLLHSTCQPHLEVEVLVAKSARYKNPPHTTE